MALVFVSRIFSELSEVCLVLNIKFGIPSINKQRLAEEPHGKTKCFTVLTSKKLLVSWPKTGFQWFGWLNDSSAPSEGRRIPTAFAPSLDHSKLGRILGSFFYLKD